MNKIYKVLILKQNLKYIKMFSFDFTDLGIEKLISKNINFMATFSEKLFDFQGNRLFDNRNVDDQLRI